MIHFPLQYILSLLDNLSSEVLRVFWDRGHVAWEAGVLLCQICRTRTLHPTHVNVK